VLARVNAESPSISTTADRATDYQQPMQRPFPFASLTVPVLDLYGEYDYPAVHRMAPERLHLIQQGGNPLSQQVIAPGADHYLPAVAIS